MRGTEEDKMTREAILDKLRDCITTQKKYHILTAASMRYPGGRFYNGIVVRFTEDHKKIVMMEEKEGIVEIYINVIKSPDDIEEFIPIELRRLG